MPLGCSPRCSLTAPRAPSPQRRPPAPEDAAALRAFKQEALAAAAPRGGSVPYAAEFKSFSAAALGAPGADAAERFEHRPLRPAVHAGAAFAERARALPPGAAGRVLAEMGAGGAGGAGLLGKAELREALRRLGLLELLRSRHAPVRTPARAGNAKTKKRKR